MWTRITSKVVSGVVGRWVVVEIHIIAFTTLTTSRTSTMDNGVCVDSILGV